MSTSYFINDRIYLRAIEPEDLDIMYAMENDPQTWDITNFTVPYSRYALRQYIENSQCDMFADCQLRLMIVRRDDGTYHRIHAYSCAWRGGYRDTQGISGTGICNRRTAPAMQLCIRFSAHEAAHCPRDSRQ